MDRRRVEGIVLVVVSACTAAFMIGAMLAYDPSHGLSRRGPCQGDRAVGVEAEVVGPGNRHVHRLGSAGRGHGEL